MGSCLSGQLLDDLIITMNHSRLDLNFDPDILARGIEPAHHVKLQRLEDFRFQIIGIGTTADGFGLQQVKRLPNGSLRSPFQYRRKN